MVCFLPQGLAPAPGSTLPQAPVPPQIPAPGGLLRKQSWEPDGGGTGGVHVHHVIMLDGAKIAQAVHTHTGFAMQFPRQAPYFDGRENYTPTD